MKIKRAKPPEPIVKRRRQPTDLSPWLRRVVEGKLRAKNYDVVVMLDPYDQSPGEIVLTVYFRAMKGSPFVKTITKSLHPITKDADAAVEEAITKVNQ